MKKNLSALYGWIDTFIFILPVGWVIACYDGAWQYFESNELLQFIWRIFQGCIFAMLLLGFGMALSGQTLTVDNKAETIENRRWIALGLELLILFSVSNKVL